LVRGRHESGLGDSIDGRYLVRLLSMAGTRVRAGLHIGSGRRVPALASTRARTSPHIRSGRRVPALASIQARTSPHIDSGRCAHAVASIQAWIGPHIDSGYRVPVVADAGMPRGFTHRSVTDYRSVTRDRNGNVTRPGGPFPGRQLIRTIVRRRGRPDFRTISFGLRG
jgi:hypothetical protein